MKQDYNDIGKVEKEHRSKMKINKHKDISGKEYLLYINPERKIRLDY